MLLQVSVTGEEEVTGVEGKKKKKKERGKEGSLNRNNLSEKHKEGAGRLVKSKRTFSG